MGVDKPNVRFIINYGLPKSLEAYYQQSGRGGRDGNPAVSIIFWSPGDMKRECFLANFTGPAELRARARVDYQLVSDYVADTVSCRRKLLLSYFGEKFDKSHATTNDECCDNCVHRQHVRKDLTPQAQVLISAITSVYLPIRKFVVEAALKTAKAKQWGYTVAWWRELLLLLRVEGYLEYVLDSERLRVTQKGTLAMSTRSPITVPATNAISAELCETGKVVLPSLSPKNRTGTVARPPLKRVLPTTFKAKVMLPCKKQPSHIERISQARLESGSSRYTGSGFTFMSLLK